MHFLEYPYVIITILVAIIFLMGLAGLYFTMKSARTAKGTAEKSFCGLGKIENDFERAGNARKSRCLLYISMPLDNMERIYSESKVMRMYEQIKRILLKHFGLKADGELSAYGKENFVALNYFKEENAIVGCIGQCLEEINDILTKFGAIGIARINFGYFLTESTDVSFKTALSRAKQACSMAEEKKEPHCRWDNLNGKEFERKIKIENNIENEIDNNRFFLEYQPIIDAKTGKLMGAEVLARLNSSTEGILTPHRFLSAVKNVGLNKKFDYYIFEKICKWISGDKESRMKYIYTINFSRYTLCDEEFAQNIVGIIKRYAVDYSCIAVEILEDKDLNKEEKLQVTKSLTYLKKKGMLVLLDDFGKGSTTLSDLTDFDISIVKIDKSITQSATTEAGLSMLKYTINAAHSLGYKTLCEGIETEEHKQIVIDAGCDILQGYYLYRPMPVAKFEELFN